MIIKRTAVSLATFGLLVATMSGCASVGSVEVGASASATASGLDTSDPITAQRAGYVATMLSNSSAAGPETQSGVMSVIAGYGGGYVTDASISGASGPTQKLTLNVVLGGSRVLDSMQGETDMGPSGIACFTYTVGYYGYSGTEKQIACASSLTTPAAEATATRQVTEQVDAEHYDTSINSKSVPTSLAEAEQLIGLGGAAHASATAGLTGANFATGTDDVQRKPDAALALPQSGGGCIYVVYRWIRASWVGGGTSGSSNSPVARSWAAPTDAACTGIAALGAGAFLTADRYAGG